MASKKGRRIIIGDVHGNINAVLKLLNAIGPGQGDSVYFLGDLIDRGPHSCDVVEFVRQHGYMSLLGNHEQMLMQALPIHGEDANTAALLQMWLHSGGNATLSSYINMDLLLEHVDWMRALPLYIDLGDIWLAHAGLNPQVSLAEQTSHDLCWIREEFHQIDRPYFAKKTIVTGHTITFTMRGVKPGELAQGEGWLDIDTGAYHPKSGWLTALDVDSWKVYQFNVYQNQLRVLPFEEVVTRVGPLAKKSTETKDGRSARSAMVSCQ
jgi:serine/threonine protein phosphatase 1